MARRRKQSDDESFSTRRLEAFSDGVFAIAITLLVLDIVTKPAKSPLEEVLNAWPSYVAYIVSFLTIGAAWIAHTAHTERLAKVDPVYLRLNLLLLLVVVFLPFPTRLVTEAFGHRDSERVAVTCFGIILFCIRGMGIIVDQYARKQHLYIADSGDVQADSSGRRKSLYALASYAAAIVIGLLLPGFAVAIYFAITLFVIIPFGAIVDLWREPDEVTAD